MRELERSVVLTQLAPNGDAVETTFRRVNPELTDTTIKMAIIKLAGLTQNTFVSLHVVDTRDITDTATSGED